MKIGSASLMLLLCCVSSVAPVLAQMRTVGDGTVFVFQPGKSESYGVRDSGMSLDSNSSFVSRHQRWGQSTGIGDSSIGTTSATVESRGRSETQFTVPVQSSPVLDTGLSRSSVSSPAVTAPVLSDTPSWQSSNTYRAGGSEPAGVTPIESMPVYSFRKRNILLP